MDGPALCDVAHYASEWPWLPVAADVLRRDLAGRVTVTVSGCRTDPWTLRLPSTTADRPSAGVVGGAAARG